MTLLDPDLWERLQSEIETQIVSCCSGMYDFGQENRPYPTSEALHYTRLITGIVMQVLAEQAQRDTDIFYDTRKYKMTESLSTKSLKGRQGDHIA